MAFASKGSQNTITADMPVPRPPSKPCAVTLFKNYAFKDFTNQTFSFTPPASCPGPWAKVVFNFDLQVSKGIQFDRTGIVWLNGGVLFFGTTAEPSPSLGPSWHVERDVTELSALFDGKSQGQVSLGNIVNSSYTGIITGTATLQFYPPTKTYPAPSVPDRVIGMPYAPPLGSAVQLPSQPFQLATALPKNILGAELELYLQSQHNEEQWFMCVPTSVWNRSKNALGFCQNTAFREGDVTVDGRPAGIAAIYPWIYTGGMDPYLWTPIPGVQTLQFQPARVDLTPFAGYLSTASSPTIAVTVHNAYDYFTGTGNLLLYLDPKAATVTGAVTKDTLSASPNEKVANNVSYFWPKGLFGAQSASGAVTVRSERNYVIAGYVKSSQGRIDTTVSSRAIFTNTQNFEYTPTAYAQFAHQNTLHSTQVTTKFAGKTTVSSYLLDWPLSIAYPITKNTSGFLLPIVVSQGSHYVQTSGATGYSFDIRNTVQARGTMIFDSKFNWTGVQGDASNQLYTYKSSSGICYGKHIFSVDNRVSAITNPGCGALPASPR